MVENSQNSDKKNYNSAIEIKKTLKRTIIQLEKAINIINQQSIKDLPNLTVVENLLNSSNALVDYLQLRNSEIENKENLVKQTIINDEEYSEISNQKENITKKKQSKIARQKEKKNSLNFILVIALLISIFSNLLIWWLKPNIIINSIENSNNNSPIESKKIEKTVNNIPIIDNQNISAEEINRNNFEENNLLNDSNSSEIINNQPLDNISEKVAETEEEITQNQNKPDDNVSNIPENSLNESLSLPLTPKESLLKNIENQISIITNKYEKKLIIKIEANFNQNILIITLSQDWYNLNNSQQNSLVKDIFNKVKSLNFYKFNIQDAQGKLLARNAVVGNEFIIIN
ncbi:hypothetical protein [Geminocystis sp. GBBB08]|uniref:hypothetical protein n=1 Tax=Geminocystis sp. GBBB08 TaxID=2604140 RepID=UPI0027E3A740|nr:hypothetical protein [Geminocystis sp. GBBB08]MBL1211220.1 hypothetical protein [Geminocystis sp. GBBB08]